MDFGNLRYICLSEGSLGEVPTRCGSEKADYCHNVLVVIPNMCGIHTVAVTYTYQQSYICLMSSCLMFSVLSFRCREIYLVSRYFMWNVKPDLLLQTALASGSATSGFPWLVLDCNGACHHHNTHDNDDNAGYALLFLVKITIVMISDKPKSLQKVS